MTVFHKRILRRFQSMVSWWLCWCVQVLEAHCVGCSTRRYHALRRLPQKVHLRISPNGIADICTREDSETIGITMDIFLFLSSLEARHVIFLCEGHHFVFCVLGMVILSTKPHLGHFGQQISLHHFCYFTYLPLDARSILHVFQGTQGIWRGGLGDGGGGGDNVRWNFHTYSILHVFQGTQGIWWGGLGGGGGGGDNVRWNFHTLDIHSILHVFHGTQNLTV